MPRCLSDGRRELDYGTQAELGDCLLGLVGKAEQPRIGVDVRGLEFCDSSGMACLVATAKIAQTRGGSLVLLRSAAHLGCQRPGPG